MILNEMEGIRTVRLQGAEVFGGQSSSVMERVWKRVLGVLCDRRLSARIKEKV